MLTSGVVPALFGEDEKEQIIGQVTQLTSNAVPIGLLPFKSDFNCNLTFPIFLICLFSILISIFLTTSFSILYHFIFYIFYYFSHSCFSVYIYIIIHLIYSKFPQLTFISSFNLIFLIILKLISLELKLHFCVRVERTSPTCEYFQLTIV